MQEQEVVSFSVGAGIPKVVLRSVVPQRTEQHKNFNPLRFPTKHQSPVTSPCFGCQWSGKCEGRICPAEQ
ncbi:MAG: hypothetical protein K9M15_03170 [Candidatus Marinimicrobia bacterium]|nr:hypothetical protein [Candidatus Neomarinimicrobiota bacterium]